MTYDFDRAIRLATQDALDTLKRDDLTDLTNPHAQEIISEHAQHAVPMYNGQLIDVYLRHRHALMLYSYDVPTQTTDELDPFVNYGNIRYAVLRLVETRMLGYLQDLIHADVD